MASSNWGLGVDVIVLENENGELFSTEFLLRFEFSIAKKLLCASLGLNRTANWRASSLSYSPVPARRYSESVEIELRHPCHDVGRIDVYVNDIFCPNLNVLVPNSENSCVYFVEQSGLPTTSPSHAVLKELSLKKGCNRVRMHAVDLDCNSTFNIYFWDRNQPVAVCDIDGTLTRSDVRGYVETVFMNQFSYLHSWAVRLISRLETDLGYNVIYLTTRPLEHQRETKDLLEHAEEDGIRFPKGPLFTNKKFIGTVLYEEMFIRDISSFKEKALNAIASAYHLAGFPRICSPFIVGFGNRVTDARAYAAAGIAEENIFILSKDSTITLWRYHKENNPGSNGGITYKGYSDSTLWSYLSRDGVISMTSEESTYPQSSES